MSISIDADKKNQRNEIKSLNKVRGREEATLHKVMRKSFSEEMTFKLVLKQPESLVVSTWDCLCFVHFVIPTPSTGA